MDTMDILPTVDTMDGVDITDIPTDTGNDKKFGIFWKNFFFSTATHTKKNQAIWTSSN